MKKLASSFRLKRKHLGIIFASFLFLFGGSVFASSTDGTVDSVNKYVWSESTGWIDFGASGGNVHVTDTALTGYAYGENVGWISLNCSNTSSCADNNYAVSNNGEGTLTGYAWGVTSGWINFAPSGGGVTINTSGVFSGYAYAENIGWLVFTTDHPVTTDWQHASSRTTASPTIVAGGGGFTSYYPTNYYTPTSTPLSVTPKSKPPLATSTPLILFSKNRKIHDKGSDIRALQKFLNTYGFAIVPTGPGSLGSESEYFGSLTQKALIKFQKANHITPAKGYFGPTTRSFITNHY